MAVENQLVTMFAATRHVIQITCVDANGAVKDITGDVIEFKLLDYAGATTAILTLTSPDAQIVFVDPVNGRVDVILLPADTDNALLGTRAFEVETDNASGTDPQVAARGSVEVKYNAGAAVPEDGVTVGTNSYVSRDDATAYLRLSSRAAAAWLALEPDAQDRALVTAFRELEKQRYAGMRTGGAAQATQFPRDSITNCDGIDRSGDSPAPVEVVEAQIELAYELSQDTALEGSSGSGSNVKKVEAGSAKVTFFRPGRDGSGNRGTRFPTVVQELIGCFLETGGAGVESFGTDAKSSFCDDSDFDVSEGFK